MARHLVTLEIAIADKTDGGAAALATGTWPKPRNLELGYTGITPVGRRSRAEVRFAHQYKR